MKAITFLIVVLLVANIANAQTQAEMNQTAAQGYYKADTELNKVYKLLMSKLDENGKNLLIKAENDWIKYRDSHCKFEASFYEGGSMQPMIYSGCLESLTADRIKELKEAIKEFGEY
ncbi:MAG: lysozyme inhibitor LprI family protein [Bacteroidota bacterium]